MSRAGHNGGKSLNVIGANRALGLCASSPARRISSLMTCWIQARSLSVNSFPLASAFLPSPPPLVLVSSPSLSTTVGSKPSARAAWLLLPLMRRACAASVPVRNCSSTTVKQKYAICASKSRPSRNITKRCAMLSTSGSASNVVGGVGYEAWRTWAFATARPTTPIVARPRIRLTVPAEAAGARSTISEWSNLSRKLPGISPRKSLLMCQLRMYLDTTSSASASVA